MPQNIVIVGGVAGGANVAAQIRRGDSASDITLFDKGEQVAFSTCGMPYYIGGIVDKRDDLLVSSDKIADKFNLNLHTNTEVTSIDRKNKQLIYQNATGEHHQSYDKLILSPGASAKHPAIEGMNDKRTFTLHTVPDMDAINHYIETEKPQSCAIAGAGFVGMEMVENLQARGIECTIIDRGEQVMKLVDKDFAGVIQDHLKAKQVHLQLGAGLTSFSNNGTVLNLTNGESVQADMTILAIGIKPNTELAEDSELDIGETGAIKVNDYMQTSDPDIYALGDAIQTNDLLTGTPRHVALAGPAHRQAFILVNHLQGGSTPYAGIQGTAIFKVFDLSVGTVGLNKTRLNHLGINYQEAVHESLSHAGYYPGGEKIRLKVLFDADHGRIYGAQAVGKEGVDKRLAVMATAMKANMTVLDLPELELGYAPPYSSPKDPINVLGYKAESMLKS